MFQIFFSNVCKTCGWGFGTQPQRGTKHGQGLPKVSRRQITAVESFHVQHRNIVLSDAYDWTFAIFQLRFMDISRSNFHQLFIFTLPLVNVALKKKMRATLDNNRKKVNIARSPLTVFFASWRNVATQGCLPEHAAAGVPSFVARLRGKTWIHGCFVHSWTTFFITKHIINI